MSSFSVRAARIRAASKTVQPASMPQARRTESPSPTAASGSPKPHAPRWLMRLAALALAGGAVIVVKPTIHVEIGQLVDTVIGIHIHAPAPSCDIGDLAYDRLNESKCPRGAWQPRDYDLKDPA